VSRLARLNERRNIMKPITFYKMSGSGNDFILIDNRNHVVDQNNMADFVKNVCRRKMSVGADGLILVENSETVDFKWRFFNADGSQAEMCGNGARCAARFACINKITEKEMAFETDAGVVEARVSDDLVNIKMPVPSDIQGEFSLTLKTGSMTMSSANTGVPHVVISTKDINDIDVVFLGREIRHHKKFSPAGTNVNFISPNDGGTIAIRTYERGVEDETLACGTGAVAAAIVTSNKTGAGSPIRVLTRSGCFLNVYFTKKDDNFSDVFLEGDARIIYRGELYNEAWKDD